MIWLHCCIATAILNMSMSVQLHTRPDQIQPPKNRPGSHQSHSRCDSGEGKQLFGSGELHCFHCSLKPELDGLQSWQWMTIQKFCFFFQAFFSTAQSISPFIPSAFHFPPSPLPSWSVSPGNTALMQQSQMLPSLRPTRGATSCQDVDRGMFLPYPQFVFLTSLCFFKRSLHVSPCVYRGLSYVQFKYGCFSAGFDDASSFLDVKITRFDRPERLKRKFLPWHFRNLYCVSFKAHVLRKIYTKFEETSHVFRNTLKSA